MKKLRIFIILTAVLAGCSAWAAKVPLTTNGVDWGTNYYDPDVRIGDRYDKLPAEAYPVWVAAYNTGSYVLSNSFLRIATVSSKGGGKGTQQTFSTKSGWDLNTDTIVEATLRVVENIDGLPSSGAQQICYGNEKIRSYVGFTADSVRTSAGAVYKHDMTEWTTVRLVFENMKDPAQAAVKVYLNNGPEPVLINKTWYPSSAALNCLRFGDMNATSGGTVDWESIRWKSDGAAEQRPAVSATAKEPVVVRDGLFQLPAAGLSNNAGPDFGLIWNTDGDISFTDLDPERSMAHLRQAIASLTNGAARTLALSVGSGSDILNYPTKVAQTWGWRQTPYDDDRSWKNRVQGGRIAVERGVDAVRVAGEQAKKSGLLFVPSYRVADSHYCGSPETYPLTSRFWLEHSRDCTIGLSPTEKYLPYRNQLNFAKEEVRAYRLCIITEILDRYADLMDGFQLDFMRTPVFFRPGEEQKNAPFLTEMLRQARKHLDAVGLVRGVRLPLLVRVPASIALCRNVGIDIETWVREGLVDVIIPAQMMSVAQEMPLTEFVRLVNGTGCRVYAGLCSRTSDWTWFYRDTMTGTPRRNPLRLAEPALFRGAAVNYKAMGVDRFEMYNFALPMRDDGIEISRRLTRPLPGEDRLYTVTQDEVWYEDFCQYQKDLPGKLTPGQPVTCRLLVGEDIAALTPQPKHVGMRLGFNGLTPGTQIQVRLNGQTVFEGAANDALRMAAKPVYGFFHIPVTDRTLLRKGDNLIETTLLDQKTKEVTLVEAVLAVLF